MESLQKVPRIPRFAIAALSLAILLSLPSGFVGCAGKPIDEADVAGLYKDAESDISSDLYMTALEKLRIIKNKFPYSKYAIDAQLRIADVYYLQESYGEAAAVYELFRDLHPKHEKAGYALFKMAKSYFNEMPDPVARDMTPAAKAMNYFREFLGRFPTAPEIPEARKCLQELVNRLAEKEVYIATFYLKRGNLKAARARYQKVIDLYPEAEKATLARKKLADIGPNKEATNSHAPNLPNVQ